MRLPLIALFAILMAMWALPLHAQEEKSGLGGVVDGSQAVPPEIIKPEGEEEVDKAEKLIEELSLADRISQLMIFKLEGGSQPQTSDRTLLKDYPPGGVVIPQITRPQDVADYVALLRANEFETSKEIPLLVGIDLFALAGEESRPIVPNLNIPSMLSWAGAGASATTREMIRVLAQDLGRMGFNFHLGPELSLARVMSAGKGNVYNFGSNPQFIAALATQIAEVMAEENIIWAPAGFPGGGENRRGNGLAVLLTPKSRLRYVDLLPYEAAIGAGVEMIHVGNTLVPTLDKRSPASLSPVVMTDLLRTILNYEGLVVAGPMDGQAIRMAANPEQAAVLALQAGADMLYWRQADTSIIRAIGAVVNAVADGTIEESLINDAFRRVINFKQSRGLLERPIAKSKDAGKLTKERAKAKQPYHLERQGVTLVKNNQEILPLTEEESMPIYITGSYGVYELADALSEYIKDIMRQRITNAPHIGRIEDFEIERILKSTLGIKTMICVLSGELDTASQRRLIRAISDAGSKVIVVYVGYPTDLQYFDAAEAMVVSYADPNWIAGAMPAIADILMGKSPVEILPALRDLELAVDESTTFNVFDVIRSPTGRLPITVAEPYVVDYAVSYRSDIALKKVSWDFGDGSKSTERVAEHSYDKPGHYTVTLVVETGEDPPVSRGFGVLVE